MKLYIAGAGGMLGEGFHRTRRDDDEIRFSDKDVNDNWLEFCDFRDYQHYDTEVKSYNPDVLIHLGAHTSLEYCEDNQSDAYMTNTIAVENAISIANDLNIPLVYISTAGIFNGNAELYDDWANPDPLGHYARSKYMGELAVQQRVSRHYIFRAGWMMGGGVPKDKKFIAKIGQQLATGAKEIFVVDDKLGTPTLTWDFANNVRAVIDTPHYGLYNMVCGGVTGRLEVATAMIEFLGLESTVQVTAVSSDYFSREFFAPRPANERLVNKKLELRNLNLMRDWKIALSDYLNDEWRSHILESRKVAKE